MTDKPGGLVSPPEPGSQQEAVHRANLALQSFGQPDSVVRQFDFWDGSYEGRRLFSDRRP